MLFLILVLFIGLELKHVVADYFLQSGWMVVGKADLRQPGGYVHAGLHAILTGLVLFAVATPPSLIAGLVVFEFVVHFLLDYAKPRYSVGADPIETPSRFWRLHGIDQLAHQLTYAVILYAVLAARGIG